MPLFAVCRSLRFVSHRKGWGEPGRCKQGRVDPVGAGPVVGEPGAEPVPEQLPHYSVKGEGCPSEAGEPAAFCCRVRGLGCTLRVQPHAFRHGITWYTSITVRKKTSTVDDAATAAASSQRSQPESLFVLQGTVINYLAKGDPALLSEIPPVYCIRPPPIEG